MSNGIYHDINLTVGSASGSKFTANPMRVVKTQDGYDLRTVDQHIAALERDIAQLRQLLADQGMMIAQLREIVQGEPPFLQPTDDWHVNE